LLKAPLCLKNAFDFISQIKAFYFCCTLKFPKILIDQLPESTFSSVAVFWQLVQLS
jgi:hypothetical protein